jgi:hypothetical protein
VAVELLVNIQFAFSDTCTSPERSVCHDFAMASKCGDPAGLRDVSSVRV